MKTETQCSTLGDIQKIVEKLKKENNPKDYLLIEFYEHKIEIETLKIIEKIDNSLKN